MADLSETIEKESLLPASSADDGQSATGRPLPELIQADQYLAAKKARRKRARGVMFSQIVTPGSLDDGGRVPPDSFGTPIGGC